MLEDEIEIPVVVSKSDSLSETVPPENDVKMEDAPNSGAENNSSDIEGKPVQMETDPKVRILCFKSLFI